VVQFEYKTKWVAPLEDLPGCFEHQNRRNVLERQTIDAVYQLYGYMTFNENKYGVLSNLQRAWFFQRIETADGRGRTLQYFGPIDIDSTHSPSMLQAFVGIILLAETTSWFHTSPTPNKPPTARYFGDSHTATCQRDTAVIQAQSYRSTIVGGSYDILPLDPCLCHFHRSSVRHVRRGFTLRATLSRGLLAGGNLDVFCKIIDLFQRKNSIAALDSEVRNYATLQNLQGVVIPRVHWILRYLGTLEYPCS
jgi:hypothetical protein